VINDAFQHTTLAFSCPYISFEAVIATTHTVFQCVSPAPLLIDLRNVGYSLVTCVILHIAKQPHRSSNYQVGDGAGIASGDRSINFHFELYHEHRADNFGDVATSGKR